MRCLTLAECNHWRDTHSPQRKWKYQITCLTPLKRLPWFTHFLLDELQPFDAALLIIDQVVFDVPAALVDIRSAAGEQRRIREAPGHFFENESEAFRAALETVFSDWIDFRVFFAPSHHALVADHDEFTTFFSDSADKVGDLRKKLKTGQVQVARYRRKVP
jgi:hypothetical protein